MDTAAKNFQQYCHFNKLYFFNQHLLRGDGAWDSVFRDPCSNLPWQRCAWQFGVHLHAPACLMFGLETELNVCFAVLGPQASQSNQLVFWCLGWQGLIRQEVVQG